MSQPTETNYPNLYDDDDSLLGEPRDREVYTVTSKIDIDDLQFYMEEVLTSVNLPVYIEFAGGEVAYVESIGGVANKIFVCSSLDDRGVLGTSVQPHGAGEDVIIGIVSRHHVLLKLAIIASQKWQGLAGLDADKSATPDPGERYAALDTGKIYYCFVNNVWVDVVVWLHSHTTGREDDDHIQYHYDGRANTWHGALPKSHILSGDDHDHFTANEGAAVLRINGGLESARPASPTKDAHIYYSTDLDGGTLFCGRNGEWEKISGVPSGGIVQWDGACPEGWTRYTDLDEKYPMGAVTAGAIGGALSHLHTYTEFRQHYHPIASSQHNTNTTGSHHHSLRFRVASGTHDRLRKSGTGGYYGSTQDGEHSHTITVVQDVTASGGGGTAETAMTEHRPASRQMVWCIKN